MDARSGLEHTLEHTNKAIKQKLNTIRTLIRNERPEQPKNPDSFASEQYKKHREATELFYYCVMLAYGELMAQAMLNRLDRDKEPNADDKYRRHYQRATHRLVELQRLMDGQATNASPTKSGQPGSKRGQDYNAIIKQLEKELAVVPDSDGLFQAVMAHVKVINFAFMKMSTIFFNDDFFKDYQEDGAEKDTVGENERESEAMLLLTRKLLTIATAVDFVFELECLVKNYALEQSSYLTLHANAFQFFQKLFSDDQESVEAQSPASFQPFFDDLKKMFNEGDHQDIEDIVGDFKEKCQEYTFSGEVVEDELRDQFNEKLRALKERYLGNGGQFDNVDVVATALNNNEALPVDRYGRLAVYANYLKEQRQPTLRRPRMDTHALDREIDSVLDTLSPSKEYRRPKPAFKPDIKMPTLAKYILMGVGIGLLVSVLAAGAIGLAYFAIHGGAAVLVPAFLATAKLLGGSTIGTWSLVTGILACPPVMGALSALHRWKHVCASLFSPASTPTIVGSSSWRSSEPVHPHSVEMRPSWKLRAKREDTLPSVVNNPSTTYARTASQKRLASPVGEQTPFIRRGSRPG